MIEVPRVLALHRETVIRWHQEEIDQPGESIYRIICQQHTFNFRLWHEEDIARSRDATDQKLAEVKRNIDALNQQRNDWIEKVDEWLTGDLVERRIAAQLKAPRNTETPGSAIDRLSILALRIYHLEEQAARSDAAADLVASVERKIEVAELQRHDLSQSLAELLEAIYAGRKRHGTYRQMKMYNDPRLNPYLYQTPARRAG